jgi:uncharacterized protein (TIGR02145 family)
MSDLSFFPKTAFCLCIASLISFNSTNSTVNAELLMVRSPADTTVNCSDKDGNVYKTVKIGGQIWMAENLKTTRFNDGTAIPNAPAINSWLFINTPAYCWYDDDTITNKNTYGALYNWYAVSTGKLCPLGWHVPAEEDWVILTDFLGGKTVAGSKLKEVGTSHWSSPNADATNESGFSALPGGGIILQFRIPYLIGDTGFWWSSTELSDSTALVRNIHSCGTELYRNKYHKVRGFSIRCIKDQ